MGGAVGHGVRILNYYNEENYCNEENLKIFLKKTDDNFHLALYLFTTFYLFIIVRWKRIYCIHIEEILIFLK